MADTSLTIPAAFSSPSSSTTTSRLFLFSAATRSPPIHLPLPRPDEFRSLTGVETGAGRSKGKRGRGSGGRIEGPGRTAPPTPGKLEAQKAKKREQRGRLPNSEDPSARHPHDYYKYGPYGPYGHRARVIGKHREGTLGNTIGATFSPVADDEEFEERARRDATALYLKTRHGFDQSKGVQYFFAFARRTHNLGSEVPWKEWTLVAHVAVESGEELDKWTLGLRLPAQMRNAITQCTAWFRPDLIYVKKPEYQLRLEPVQQFVDALAELLVPFESHGSKDRDSYYGKFCGILGLDVDASEGTVCATYDALDEEGQLMCLEHLLCNNPVELLHPFTRARMEEDRRQRSAKVVDEVPSVDEGFLPERSEDYNGLSENERQNEDQGVWDSEEECDKVGKAWLEDKEDFLTDELTEDIDEAKWHEKMKALSEEDEVLSEEDAETLAESESSDGATMDEKVDANERSGAPTLRTAVRPYTYRDLIKDVFLIRQQLLKARLN